MCMWDPNLLISKLNTIYTLSLRTIISYHYVPSLHHEIWYYSMEITGPIVEILAFFTSTKCSEILDCYRNLIFK